VVSAGIISGFERSEMPRRDRRMHSLSEIRKRMARLHDHEATSTKSTNLYMRHNCATSKVVMAFYF
jgi:hypothetical protein